MGRLASKRDDYLRKKQVGGGIMKEPKLTAIEKRRRMIEAGRKYTALNGVTLHVNVVGRQQCLADNSAKLTHSSAVEDTKKIDEEHEKKEAKGVNKSLEQHKPSLLSQSVRSFRFPDRGLTKCSNGGTENKPPNVPFERDARSLCDIINQRPIAQVVGRLSQTRQRERLSLFPNGINPLDEAAIAKSHPPLPSLMSPKDSDASSASLRPSVDSTNVTSLQTPSGLILRSSCKKTPKSVRFNDMVAFRSPSMSHHETSLQLRNMLRLDVSDDELNAQLGDLTIGAIMRLKNAIYRITRNAEEEGDALDSKKSQCIEEGSIESGKQGDGDVLKRQSQPKKLRESGTCSASKLFTTAEREHDHTKMMTRSVRRAQMQNLLPPVSGKSHKALSQVYADQEVMLLTDNVGGRDVCDADSRPSDPLVSVFGTPENHFLPISPQQQ